MSRLRTGALALSLVVWSTLPALSGPRVASAPIQVEPSPARSSPGTAFTYQGRARSGGALEWRRRAGQPGRGPVHAAGRNRGTEAVMSGTGKKEAEELPEQRTILSDDYWTLPDVLRVDSGRPVLVS